MIGSEEFHPFSASPRPTQDSYSQQLNLYALPKMIEPQKCSLKGRSARLKCTRMDGQSGGEGDSSRYLSLNTFLFSLPSRKKNPLSKLARHTWTVPGLSFPWSVWAVSGAASPRLPVVAFSSGAPQMEQSGQWVVRSSCCPVDLTLLSTVRDLINKVDGA